MKLQLIKSSDKRDNPKTKYSINAVKIFNDLNMLPIWQNINLQVNQE